VTENPVKEQVKNLIALQEIDAQIYDYKRELKEKPAFLDELKNQFESKKTRLRELEDKHKASQVQRKQWEGDLKAQEDNIAKANAQLSQIKTNKEYTAKISEIENLKADKSQVEEKILMSFDSTDGIKAEIEREKGLLAEEEKRYMDARKEIDAAIKELQGKVQQLETQRQEVTPHIEKSILARYEKILVNKEGLAIVPIQGSSCGGCFMNIPAQVINEIRMGEKIIYCEMCARMLYEKEEA